MTNSQRIEAVSQAGALMVERIEMALDPNTPADTREEAWASADWWAGHALRVGAPLPGAGRAA